MRRTVEFKRKQKVIVVDDKYEHASGVRELVNLENDYEVLQMQEMHPLLFH